MRLCAPSPPTVSRSFGSCLVRWPVRHPVPRERASVRPRRGSLLRLRRVGGDGRAPRDPFDAGAARLPSLQACADRERSAAGWPRAPHRERRGRTRRRSKRVVRRSFERYRRTRSDRRLGRLQRARVVSAACFRRSRGRSMHSSRCRVSSTPRSILCARWRRSQSPWDRPERGSWISYGRSVSTSTRFIGTSALGGRRSSSRWLELGSECAGDPWRVFGSQRKNCGRPARGASAPDMRAPWCGPSSRKTISPATRRRSPRGPARSPAGPATWGLDLLRRAAAAGDRCHRSPCGTTPFRDPPGS